MNEMDKNLDTEDFEPRIYEIGYHIIPTVAESNLIPVADTIKEFIVSVQGVVISEDNPKQVDLAYRMDHIVANKKTIFDNAYFGWIKFEGNPENILKIKDFLEKNENVLRFLIIKTVRESTLPKKINPKAKQTTDENVKEKPEEKKKPLVEKEKEVVSEKEVDKAIEELVA